MLLYRCIDEYGSGSNGNDDGASGSIISFSVVFLDGWVTYLFYAFMESTDRYTCSSYIKMV